MLSKYREAHLPCDIVKGTTDVDEEDEEMLVGDVEEADVSSMLEKVEMVKDKIAPKVLNNIKKAQSRQKEII